MLNRKWLGAIALYLGTVSTVLACTTAADLCLNEIQTFGSGSPASRRAQQYIELRGPAAASIATGTWLVSVDGDRNQNPGSIDVVLDLGGKVIGGNGFLVLLPAGNGFAVDPGANAITSGASGFSGIAGWTGSVAFERPSTSFFLVSAASAPTPGADIDSNNDGVPDGAEWAAWTLIDSVALADNANDKTYAALNFRPGTSTVGTTVSMAVRAWYAGRFGDSFGVAATAWVDSGPLGGANPNFLLSATNAVPAGVASKPLNHIGASNAWPNAAPVNGLPLAPVLAEDGTLPLALSLADSDAGSASLSVALALDAGTLTLASLAGISIDAGSDGSGAVTLSGTLTALNAAIAGATFAPPANFNGNANLTMVSNDNGSFGTDGPKSDSDVLAIQVTAVNDAPSFTIGANQTVTADAGPQTVPAFATAIAPGPADESGQALTFEVTPDLSALFAQAPAIAADGTLSYAPNPASTGVATISVVLRDDGGVAGGGVDASSPQTFTITIEAPLVPTTVLAFVDDDADNLLPLNGVVHVDVDFSRTIDFASVAVSDFALVGDAAATIDSVVAVDADTVRLTLTATGSGSFQVALTGVVLDLFLTPVTVPASDDDTLVVDAVAPLPVSISKLDADLPVIPFVRFEFVFDEAVSGVDPNDFALVTTGGISGALVIGTSGSGTTFEVQVYTGLASGTIGIDLLDDDSIADAAGNPLGSGLAGTQVYTIDAAVLIPVFSDGFEN